MLLIAVRPLFRAQDNNWSWNYSENANIIVPMGGNRSAPGPQKPKTNPRDPPGNSTPELHNPATLYYFVFL